MKLKYLVMNNLGSLKDIIGFIIFPEFEKHSSVAYKYKNVLSKTGREHVIGAGFIRLISKSENRIEAHCYGKSVSLKIESRKEDSKLLTSYINKE